MASRWTWPKMARRTTGVNIHFSTTMLFAQVVFYSTSFQDLQLTALPPNLFQCVTLAFAATMACNPFVGGLATHSPYIAHQGRGSFSTRAVLLKFILLSFISSKQLLTPRSFTPGIVIHCVGKFIILWISPFETATCTHCISHSMNFVWLVIDNELR